MVFLTQIFPTVIGSTLLPTAQLRWSGGHFQEAQPDPAPVDSNGDTYVDYVWTPDNYTLKMAAQNQTSYTGSGDFIRVITKWTVHRL